MKFKFYDILRLFTKSESFFHGFVISFVLNIITKILAFLISVLTAYYFGSSNKTDMFFYAISSVMIFSGFLINLDAVMIIPRYMKLRESNNIQKANNFIVYVLWAYFFIMSFVAVLVYLFPVQSISLFSKFDKTTIQINSGMIRLSSPLVIFLTLNSLLIDTLNSFKHFSLSVISWLINNVTNIIIILFFHKILGVKSIILGLLAGNILQFIFLIYFFIRISGCRLWPVNFPFDRKDIYYMLYSQGAYICSLFGGFLPLYTLSGYSAGVISAVGYGQKLMDIMTVILVIQFANIFAIKLNEQFIHKVYDKIRFSFFSIGKKALFLSIPVSILISVLVFEFISVIFIRGEFGYEAGIEASRFTRVFVLIVPLLIVHTMVARLLMAAEKIDKCFFFSIDNGDFSGNDVFGVNTDIRSLLLSLFAVCFLSDQFTFCKNYT